MCKKRQTIRDVRSKSNEKGLIHSIRKNQSHLDSAPSIIESSKKISRENDQRSHAVDRLPKCNRREIEACESYPKILKTEHTRFILNRPETR